jgi:hypothetical protein
MQFLPKNFQKRFEALLGLYLCSGVQGSEKTHSIDAYSMRTGCGQSERGCNHRHCNVLPHVP